MASTLTRSILSDMSRHDPAWSDSATRNSASVSTDLVIETPENVVLTYRLAGPAVRLLAYLIDFVVRGMIVFAAFIFVIAGGWPECWGFRSACI